MNRKILSSQWFKYAAMIVIGLFLGWLIFKDSEVAHVEHDHDETTENTIWTCSMHPQIRQTEPGKCPLCGMALIPASTPSGGGSMNDFEFVMTPQAMALANVSTTSIGTAKTENHLNLTGKIQVDEQRLATISATFPGRIEQLYVNFTGQEIRKGQKLASIYSPEMITAQKELQEAASTKSANPILYEAARERLLSWRINESQIDAIEQSGRIQTQFDIYSDRSGVVVNRMVAVGDYVGRGGALLDVVDLNHLWVVLDAYETDLSWINMGDEVRFSVAALPGREFTAKVTYVDPVINPATRTASIRAETTNKDGRLKPEMFVNAQISASVTKNDQTESLVIPRTAVLWTGQRSVVYVKVPGRDQPTFEMREIALGPRMNDRYIVEEGLNSGEEIVTNGVFSIDAAAQLQGNVSMMNPTGGRVGTVHDHGQMGDSQQDQTRPRPQSTEKFSGINERFKKQIEAIYTSYLDLKNALVDSDINKAKSGAESAKNALDNVDMTLVKGNAHDVWMEKLGTMSKALDDIKNRNDLERQRVAFAALSEALYQSLVQFSVDDVDAYYQHCPMALNDKGANWLSEIEEIRNPYFGEGMLTCGWTEERL